MAINNLFKKLGKYLMDDFCFKSHYFFIKITVNKLQKQVHGI